MFLELITLFSTASDKINLLIFMNFHPNKIGIPFLWQQEPNATEQEAALFPAKLGFSLGEKRGNPFASIGSGRH